MVFACGSEANFSIKKIQNQKETTENIEGNSTAREANKEYRSKLLGYSKKIKDFLLGFVLADAGRGRRSFLNFLCRNSIRGSYTRG